MARYIDADKIRQFVKEKFNNDVPYEWAWTLTAIDKQPTADVAEIVRCKDCKHVRENKYMCICYRHGIHVTEESYCSYGEMKEGEQ